MTITVKGDYAKARTLMQAAQAGNVSFQAPASITLAALAQNEVAAVARIPAYSLVVGAILVYAALGANTVLEIGHESEDGETSDPDAIGDVADASSAGSGFFACTPFQVTKDSYLTVKNTGAGAASGVVSAIPVYIYQGR